MNIRYEITISPAVNIAIQDALYDIPHHSLSCDENKTILEITDGLQEANQIVLTIE